MGKHQKQILIETPKRDCFWEIREICFPSSPGIACISAEGHHIQHTRSPQGARGRERKHFPNSNGALISASVRLQAGRQTFSTPTSKSQKLERRGKIIHSGRGTGAWNVLKHLTPKFMNNVN